MRSMLTRLIREPLLHFLLLAIAFFVVHGLFNREAELPDQITVTSSRIEQLSGYFAKANQRPPSPDELKGLIDDYVKEEIYYREARKIGLDTDDTVIRRRLRQKMEFLSDAGLENLAPSDAELQAYLDAHQAAFEVEPQIAFEQIFLDEGRRGGKTGDDADALLKAVRTNAGSDPGNLGDPTLLPPEMPLTGRSTIAQVFGSDFAAAVDLAPVGVWSGPLRSTYGVHIVRVTSRTPGQLPKLSEVRQAVVREWTETERRKLEEARFNELLKHYRITVQPRAPAPAAP